MNKISSFVLFFAGVSSLFSCGPAPEESVVPAPVTFVTQTHKWQSQRCPVDSSACLSMSVAFPLAEGDSSGVIHLVNDSIQYYVRSSMAVFAVNPEDVAGSMDSIAAELIGEYETLLEESPEYAMPWEVSVAGKVLSQSDRWASVSVETYSYTGGAHPNTFLSLLNFDLSTGKTLTLADITANPSKLEALVQVKFREAREVLDDQSFDDAGYFWGQGFALPANFALTAEGLYFYYNPYEAAAYALGPTEFTVPYSLLEGILKPEWLKILQ